MFGDFQVYMDTNSRIPYPSYHDEKIIVPQVPRKSEPAIYPGSNEDCREAIPDPRKGCRIITRRQARDSMGHRLVSCLNLRVSATWSRQGMLICLKESDTALNFGLVWNATVLRELIWKAGVDVVAATGLLLCWVFKHPNACLTAARMRLSVAPANTGYCIFKISF